MFVYARTVYNVHKSMESNRLSIVCRYVDVDEKRKLYHLL